MNYVNVNYSMLRNIKQIKFGVVIFIISLLIIMLMYISCIMYGSKVIMLYGIINGNVIETKYNIELSDAFNKVDYITFNNKRVTIIDYEYKGYELINDSIYQNIYITIDEELKNNEVGKLKVKYDRKRIIKYIVDLLK